ncbi:hypothetical protein EV182_004730, partial [Spiromyces aspiralis]
MNNGDEGPARAPSSPPLRGNNDHQPSPANAAASLGNNPGDRVSTSSISAASSRTQGSPNHHHPAPAGHTASDIDDEKQLDEVDRIPEDLLRPAVKAASSPSLTASIHDKNKKKKKKGGFLAKLTGDAIIEEHAEEKEKKDSAVKVDILAIPPVPLFSLYRFMGKFDAILIFFGTISAVIVGVATPVMTIVFSNLMNDFNEYSRLRYILGDIDAANHTLSHSSRKYCLYFTIIGIIMWVCGYIMHAAWTITSEHQGFRIRNRYYESILRQDIGWFDTISTGDLTTRISGDVNMIQEAIGDKVGFTIQFLATFFSAFIIAFVRGWKLAFVMCAILPFLVATAGIMGRIIARWMTMGQDFYAEAGAVADEVLSSIRTVMAFNSQERELKRYEKKIHTAYIFGRNKGLVLGIGVGFIMFFIYGFYALGFWFGSTRIVAGEYDMAEVLNVFMALLIGSFTLGSVAPNLSIISSGRGAAARIFSIIERKSPIDAVDQTSGKIIDRLEGDIEFRDVHFRYPSRPDVKILHGFNLKVKPGQKIALVGESGCGKSTTVGLVERFYDPEAGEILIDGVNVKDYNVRSLRQNIGIVTQEPVLFSTSIYQNIVWGAVDPENNPPTKDE